MCVFFFYYVSQITRNFCQWREWISSRGAVSVEWLCVSVCEWGRVCVCECLNELWLAKCMVNRQLRFRGVMCVHTNLSLCPSHMHSLSHSLSPSLLLSLSLLLMCAFVTSQARLNFLHQLLPHHRLKFDFLALQERLCLDLLVVCVCLCVCVHSGRGWRQIKLSDFQISRCALEFISKGQKLLDWCTDCIDRQLLCYFSISQQSSARL